MLEFSVLTNVASRPGAWNGCQGLGFAPDLPGASLCLALFTHPSEGQALSPHIV